MRRDPERAFGARRPQPAQADRRRAPAHARDDSRVRARAPRRIRRRGDVPQAPRRRVRTPRRDRLRAPERGRGGMVVPARSRPRRLSSSAGLARGHESGGGRWSWRVRSAGSGSHADTSQRATRDWSRHSRRPTRTAESGRGRSRPPALSLLEPGGSKRVACGSRMPSPGGGSSTIETRLRARSKRSAGSSCTTPATTTRRSRPSRRRVRSGRISATEQARRVHSSACARCSSHWARWSAPRFSRTSSSNAARTTCERGTSRSTSSPTASSSAGTAPKRKRDTGKAFAPRSTSATSSRRASRYRVLRWPRPARTSRPAPSS